MALAYGIMLIRPLALVAEIIAAPVAVLSNLGLGPQLPTLLLFATTAVAAGFAAFAVPPIVHGAAGTGRVDRKNGPAGQR